ncbi:hypothetical protein LTR35_001794 [Friedmanniomyces endolithicus]|uniref:Uncharacterized protein n=1 Tax=Friedmanniomyces endolithicus TaxID=329885 RepID=A0AAN6JCY4_9PEZI|nr:hypothetical protein LTR35_001794 [Friedmanniomyces endolithicus]KAK0296880.1 hypothetical protein LTS00_004680 [Friedmanniomyces endolithicus]KAK0325400.1 hypothetical protein LTR82_003683 [Friedmanniomyces endolithicus]KAK1011123.1 hypothetical protein LTR54_005041 [Friedmanniomyces endolithicus]
MTSQGQDFPNTDYANLLATARRMIAAIKAPKPRPGIEVDGPSVAELAVKLRRNMKKVMDSPLEEYEPSELGIIGPTRMTSAIRMYKQAQEIRAGRVDFEDEKTGSLAKDLIRALSPDHPFLDVDLYPAEDGAAAGMVFSPAAILQDEEYVRLTLYQDLALRRSTRITNRATYVDDDELFVSEDDEGEEGDGGKEDEKDEEDEADMASTDDGQGEGRHTPKDMDKDGERAESGAGEDRGADSGEEEKPQVMDWLKGVLDRSRGG